MASPLDGRSPVDGVPSSSELERRGPDTSEMDPVNKKVALAALATGLFGLVMVGFKTGVVCAVIAGGLVYRNHHPEAFKGAEAQINKWVSDVNAYIHKNFPDNEEAFVMVGNYFKNIGNKACDLLVAIAVPESSLPAKKLGSALTEVARSGLDFVQSLLPAGAR